MEQGKEGKGTNTPAEPESPEQFELLPPPNGDGEHMNLDQHWAKFWNAYPRRKEPRAARTAWDKARKLVPIPVIQAGVERYARELAGQDIKFAKYPATWLNAGCWADDPDPAPPANGARAGQSRPLSEAEVRMRALNPHLNREETP